MPEDEDRLQKAFRQFDEANHTDPNTETHDGRTYPKELLYAERMTVWLERLEPDASTAVQLAARSQHLCRWKIPRDRYPRDRDGYRRWRSDLADFHAETAGRMLREIGYDDDMIERVQSLLRKQRLKADPDCQLLEDVICLVFLEYYFSDFAEEHDEPKLIGILRRTWKKMSPRGHQAALELEFPPAAKALVQNAIDGEAGEA